ncbi:MAG: sigma-70 family RNA polymerase sigma factor, partial [Planctomycetes bacterium]|nr:sigma-70 family RNA polymerase sigma factor [Planctomycetota bacterium]
AATAREKLDPRRPCEALMERIESLLARAQVVREHLVRANLRLVVAIAKRHRGRRTDFPALVSNGNVALLDAIEAFDYSRGNRFSTYAGWAIVRRFARTVPEESYAVTGIEEEILENSAKVEIDYTALGPAAVEKGVVCALAGLPERERVIIESRFGLGRAKSPSTLQEIGSRFGVTKERIRQIEAQALSRLKQIVESNVPELVP